MIRRKIKEVAYTAIPKTRGDTGSRVAETLLDQAKQKAQSAALIRFIDQMQSDAIT